MTTLSPYLNGFSKAAPPQRRADAFRRVISILLQGVIRHGFDGSDRAAGFQDAVGEIRRDMENIEDEDAAVLLAGATVRLMEDHSEAALLQTKARQNEFESAIAILTEALLDVSRASAESMVRFKEIERDLAGASTLEALRAVKRKLGVAVEAIREELANPVGWCGARIPRGEIDSTTGLPDYGFAAAAIAEVWLRREEYYCAIFAAERLESINSRFGLSAGDQVLRLLSEHAARNLNPGDRLFRWRGPCVMALMKRGGSGALVAGELSRLTMTKISHAIAIRDREVILPVSISWNLFPLQAATGIEEMLGRMNTFAASRALAQPNNTRNQQ